MTHYEIERVDFEAAAVRSWGAERSERTNWPIVYLLDGPTQRSGTGPAGFLGDVYVGESLNVASRLRQHLDSGTKAHLQRVRVVVDETFNKSACLDLESYLIQMLAGDGRYRVLNRNDGIVDADYFDRLDYRHRFTEIFEHLRSDGLFGRSSADIENDDLFKLSPFKALTLEQEATVFEIMRGLLRDLAAGGSSESVIQGDPGTGKTVVAVYLMKLLADIRDRSDDDPVDTESVLSMLFTAQNRDLLRGIHMGFVVPQQSLRKSVQRVFRKTRGLNPSMVMSPFDVGLGAAPYDLLIVDETHRLSQSANQSSGQRNKQFGEINARLFGSGAEARTQLDWIRACGRHRVYLLDAAQSVRPADLPAATLAALVSDAEQRGGRHRLTSQMRVQAGFDYVRHVRSVLRSAQSPAETALRSALRAGPYDFRFFDDLGAMRNAIRARDAEHGLARLVAGYAWDWRSRTDATAFDIELDGIGLRWNGTDVDWINSPGSLEEVGSIHTVQGYDLNYAGVIIGPDLRYDPEAGLFIERESYRDKKGKENNRRFGKRYDDADLLAFITNIYAVLLTRGIRGTYVYVCDQPLREYLASRF